MHFSGVCLSVHLSLPFWIKLLKLSHQRVACVCPIMGAAYTAQTHPSHVPAWVYRSQIHLLVVTRQFINQLLQYSLRKCLLSDERWQVVKGRFAAVNSFLMSCRCRYSIEGPAPAAHLGDGCTDLVIVHRCSRFDYTKHLYRCSDHRADQVRQLSRLQVGMCLSCDFLNMYT